MKNISYPVANSTTLSYYEKAFSFDTWSKNKDKIQTYLAPYYSFLYDGGKACSCNGTGSHNSSSCDANGGQCRCKPNVDGINCDRCKAGFFNFSDAGCQGKFVVNLVPKLVLLLGMVQGTRLDETSEMKLGEVL